MGGYEDWLRQRTTAEPGVKPPGPIAPGFLGAEAVAKAASRAGKKKLSFNEQREIDELPGRIERLETEQTELLARIASPDFYKEPADAIAAALSRVDVLKDSLHDVYARWDELDSRSKA